MADAELNPVLGSGPNGEGTQLFLTDGNGVEFRIPKILTCNRPNGSVGITETTNHDSGGVREYIGELLDPGELAATGLLDPGGEIDAKLTEHLYSRENRTFRISEVKSDGTFYDSVGIIILTNYEPDDAPVDGRREFSLSAKVSGMPTSGVGTRT